MLGSLVTSSLGGISLKKRCYTWDHIRYFCSCLHLCMLCSTSKTAGAGSSGRIIDLGMLAYSPLLMKSYATRLHIRLLPTIMILQLLFSPLVRMHSAPHFTIAFPSRLSLVALHISVDHVPIPLRGRSV